MHTLDEPGVLHDDRRSILVALTAKGTETMEEARRYHRDGIERPLLAAPL